MLHILGLHCVDAAGQTADLVGHRELFSKRGRRQTVLPGKTQRLLRDGLDGLQYPPAQSPRPQGQDDRQQQRRCQQHLMRVRSAGGAQIFHLFLNADEPRDFSFLCLDGDNKGKVVLLPLPGMKNHGPFSPLVDPGIGFSLVFAGLQHGAGGIQFHLRMLLKQGRVDSHQAESDMAIVLPLRLNEVDHQNLLRVPPRQTLPLLLNVTAFLRVRSPVRREVIGYMIGVEIRPRRPCRVVGRVRVLLSHSPHDLPVAHAGHDEDDQQKTQGHPRQNLDRQACLKDFNHPQAGYDR